MNEREKRLAIAVAAAVTLWFGNIGWGKYQDAVKQNVNKQQSVAQKLSEARLATARGERAQSRIKQWQEQSLPTDPDFAKSLYQDWLRQQLTESGLQVKGLDLSSPRSNSKSYRQYTFDVNATGRLGQLTDFLYRFYQAKHLHRVRKTTLTPSDDRRELTIAMTVDALSLPGAQRTDQLADGKSDDLKQSLQQFQAEIGDRNLFATYQPARPRGMRPPRDGGDSEAAQAVFSGIHSGEGGWLMLVRMQDSGKVFRFREGDRIRIGRFRGTVEQLDGDQRRAIVSRGPNRVQILFGKSLAEALPFNETAG